MEGVRWRKCTCTHVRESRGGVIAATLDSSRWWRCIGVWEGGGRDARGFQMCWYMEPTSAERLGVGRRQSVAAPPPAPAITPPAPNLLLSSTFLLLVLPPFSLCFFSFLLFFWKREREREIFIVRAIRINPFFANFECMEYIFFFYRLLEFKDSSTFYLLILSFLKFFFYLLYRRIEIRKDE